MKKLTLTILALAVAMSAPLSADAKTKKKAQPAAPAAFSIKCNATTGVSSYLLGKTVIGTGPECGEGWEPSIAQEKTFPNKRRVILVAAGGGGMASSGSIVMLAPGAKPFVVPVEYMTEFGEIRSDTQVTIVAQGQVDINAEPCTTLTLVTLNWTTGKTTDTELGSEGGCG